jgi:hypothetical protein
VYVPPQHRAICAQIYDQLRVPVEFHEPGSAEGSGQISVKYSPELQEALIQVGRVGAETAAEIRRTRHSLYETRGAEAVFLELPLAQAGTPEPCRATLAHDQLAFRQGADFLRREVLGALLSPRESKRILAGALEAGTEAYGR